MKNVKLNLKKTAKAGFSLVEMLVVIAVIGVIAAIAIPNIGSINDSARGATAQRNAQSVASVLNAAAAAGYDLGAAAQTGQQLVDLAEGGVQPLDGAFVGKNFTSGEIDDDEETLAAGHLTYDATNKQVIYTP
jgi:type IV pilus assembly protein PilA